MSKKLKWFGVSMLAAGLIAAGVIYTHFDEAVPYVAMGINYFRYMNAPKGTIFIEIAPNVAALPAPAKPIALLSDSDADWPSYNKTLTSERFSTLDQITP
jgi:alcohol dehydrogenase (cytochrome c)